MPDYTKLRNLVSHRVIFDYDNGARIEGYVGQTKPAQGPIQAVLLSRALLRAPDGTVALRRDELTVVPNLLVATQREAGNGKVSYEFDTGVRIAGAVTDDVGASAGIQRLEQAVIHDANGRVLERHDELVVVPRPLERWRIAEGPGGF